VLGNNGICNVKRFECRQRFVNDALVFRPEVWNDKNVVVKLYSLFMGNIPAKSQVGVACITAW